MIPGLIVKQINLPSVSGIQLIDLSALSQFQRLMVYEQGGHLFALGVATASLISPGIYVAGHKYLCMLLSLDTGDTWSAIIGPDITTRTDIAVGAIRDGSTLHVVYELNSYVDPANDYDIIPFPTTNYFAVASCDFDFSTATWGTPSAPGAPVVDFLGQHDTVLAKLPIELDGSTPIAAHIGNYTPETETPAYMTDQAMIQVVNGAAIATLGTGDTTDYEIMTMIADAGGVHCLLYVDTYITTSDAKLYDVYVSGGVAAAPVYIADIDVGLERARIGIGAYDGASETAVPFMGRDGYLYVALYDGASWSTLLVSSAQPPADTTEISGDYEAGFARALYFGGDLYALWISEPTDKRDLYIAQRTAGVFGAATSILDVTVGTTGMDADGTRRVVSYTGGIFDGSVERAVLECTDAYYLLLLSWAAALLGCRYRGFIM